MAFAKEVPQSHHVSIPVPEQESGKFILNKEIMFQKNNPSFLQYHTLHNWDRNKSTLSNAEVTKGLEFISIGMECVEMF